MKRWRIFALSVFFGLIAMGVVINALPLDYIPLTRFWAAWVTQLLAYGIGIAVFGFAYQKLAQVVFSGLFWVATLAFFVMIYGAALVLTAFGILTPIESVVSVSIVLFFIGGCATGRLKSAVKSDDEIASAFE